MNRSRWMKWGILVLALALCIPGLALAQAQASGGHGGGNGAAFAANNPQPLLIYTVWGGTVAGSNASTLVVYDNGLAIWAQSNAGSLSGGSSGTGTGTGNSVQVVQISRTQVNQLMLQLRQAGAFRQVANNGNPQSSDTPLTTVTVFSRPAGSRSAASFAETFSYYESTGTSRASVQNVFTNFFNNTFNGSGGSGSGQ